MTPTTTKEEGSEMSTDSQNDMMRKISSIGTAITTASLIGMGALMLQVREDNAVMKVELLAIKDLVSFAGASRYTRDQATSDWRFQESVNTQVAAEIDRIDARYSEWLGRLSTRLAEVEQFQRDAQD